MKRYGYMVVLVLIATTISGCLGSSRPPTGSIVGEIRSIDHGNAIAGAVVEIAGKTLVTGSDGRFQINDIPVGVSEMTISHYNYYGVREDVRIEGGKPADYTKKNAFELGYYIEDPRSTGALAGYIYVRKDSQMNASSMSDLEPLFSAQAYPPTGYEPLRGADVMIDYWYDAYQKTDEKGLFYFSGIAPGRYQLEISHPSLRFEIDEPVWVEPGYMTWFGGHNAIYGGIGYYIVIGIDDYNYEPKRLSGPINDAFGVYETLFEGNVLAGLGELLINGGDPKNEILPATRGEIERSIGRATRMAKSENDFLVIYFSGNSGLDFLSPWGDNGKRDEKQLITDVQLERWVRDFPGNVTLIIDGPNSGTMADGQSFVPFALRRNTRYTVLASSQDGQEAYYDKNSGNSLFTSILLEGIESRNADFISKDREITARELYEYAERKMEEKNRDWEEKDHQNPHIHEGYYGNTVIFRY